MERSLGRKHGTTKALLTTAVSATVDVKVEDTAAVEIGVLKPKAVPLPLKDCGVFLFAKTSESSYVIQ